MTSEGKVADERVDDSSHRDLPKEGPASMEDQDRYDRILKVCSILGETDTLFFDDCSSFLHRSSLFLSHSLYRVFPLLCSLFDSKERGKARRLTFHF